MPSTEPPPRRRSEGNDTNISLRLHDSSIRRSNEEQRSHLMSVLDRALLIVEEEELALESSELLTTYINRRRELDEGEGGSPSDSESGGGSPRTDEFQIARK